MCVCVCVASKRDQGIKVFTTKPEDLGSIPRTNMVGGNHSHKLYSDDHIKTVTHACTCNTYAIKCYLILKKIFFLILGSLGSSYVAQACSKLRILLP